MMRYMPESPQSMIKPNYDYMGRRYTKKVTSNGTVRLQQRYIYRGYRHYNPQDGRWINRDPIHKTNSSNLYCFVFNSPLRWIDLLGREVDDDEVGVGWVVDPALEGVNVYVETGTKITSNTVKIQKEMETLAKTAKAGSLANAAAPSHLWSSEYNKNVSKIMVQDKLN